MRKKYMIWIWVIIAVVVIAGLLFWVKSGKKDEGTDLSAGPEPSEPAETPEPSVETPDQGATEPEAPETKEESSPDEEKRE